MTANSTYLVSIPASLTVPEINGVNSVIVNAAGTADAQALAAAYLHITGAPAIGTLVVSAPGSAVDANGMVLTVQVNNGTTTLTSTATGVAGTTMDNLGSSVVAGLVGTYTNVAYNTSTDVITFGTGDNVGTFAIGATLSAPVTIGIPGGGIGQDTGGVTLTELVALTNGGPVVSATGTAALARTITLPPDGVFPMINAGLRDRSLS